MSIQTETCTVCGKPATVYGYHGAAMVPRCADHGIQHQIRSQADIDRIAALEAERDKYRAEVHRMTCAILHDSSDAYQHQAARTMPDISYRDALDMTALGIAGEAGEIADAWKKTRWHGHAYNPDEDIKELGDLLWYIAMRAHTLNVKLSTIMARNISKLKERYPSGFDPDRSQHRDDDGRGRVASPAEPSSPVTPSEE